MRLGLERTYPEREAADYPTRRLSSATSAASSEAAAGDVARG